jgi:hypothetical protein
VAHTLLGSSDHLLKDGTTDVELGPDHLDRQDPERLTQRLGKRLERLGHKVTREPRPAA